MQLVHQYLHDTAVRFPKKPAIICDEKTLSYEGFIGQMTSLADRCIVEGLHKGDRVLILLRDKIDFITACYAVMRAGGIAVPLMESVPMITIQEIAKDCKPFIFITSRVDLQAYPLLRDLLSCHFFFTDDPAVQSENGTNGNPISHHNLKLDSTDRIVQLMDLRDDDGALILYTSGSTGAKNGVLLTHRNLIESAQNINTFMQIDDTAVELVTLPLAQSFGFGRTRCLLFVGGTIVVNNGMLKPLGVIQSILKHHCNALSSVPATFSILFGHIESLLQTVGPQIRYIELGSSPMPIAEKKKILDLFPSARICMHYGLSEAPRSAFIEFRSEAHKIETSGRPSPNVDIAICNDEGILLDRGQTGEIIIRGAHVFSGYWNNETLTKKHFLKGRWFRSGDMGFIDQEGYVHLLGRKDEMINLAGMKISPFEVEERIRAAYPDCEICVIGIPDPAGVVGEIPVLCYVGRENKTIIPSELSTALSNQIDRNKIPRIVYRVSAFPRADNKILRHELRRQLIDGMSHPIQQAL